MHEFNLPWIADEFPDDHRVVAKSAVGKATIGVAGIGGGSRDAVGVAGSIHSVETLKPAAPPPKQQNPPRGGTNGAAAGAAATGNAGGGGSSPDTGTNQPDNQGPGQRPGKTGNSPTGNDPQPQREGQDRPDRPGPAGGNDNGSGPASPGPKGAGNGQGDGEPTPANEGSGTKSKGPADGSKHAPSEKNRLTARQIKIRELAAEYEKLNRDPDTTDAQLIQRSLAVAERTGVGHRVVAAMREGSADVRVLDNQDFEEVASEGAGGFYTTGNDLITVPRSNLKDPLEGADLLIHEGTHFWDHNDPARTSNVHTGSGGTSDYEFESEVSAYTNGDRFQKAIGAIDRVRTRDQLVKFLDSDALYGGHE